MFTSCHISRIALILYSSCYHWWTHIHSLICVPFYWYWIRVLCVNVPWRNYTLSCNQSSTNPFLLLVPFGLSFMELDMEQTYHSSAFGFFYFIYFYFFWSRVVDYADHRIHVVVCFVGRRIKWNPWSVVDSQPAAVFLRRSDKLGAQWRWSAVTVSSRAELSSGIVVAQWMSPSQEASPYSAKPPLSADVSKTTFPHEVFASTHQRRSCCWS